MKKINKLQFFFIFIFIIISFYIIFIKTELYESYSNIVIKNLNTKSASYEGISLILPSTSSTQDIYMIQSYLQSFDELSKLDKKFKLKKYYSSKKVDFINRLYKWSKKEDFLKRYLKDLIFYYDQTTGIITIGFLHSNPLVAYKITNQLIKDANQKLNNYYKILTKKQLSYIKKEVEINKKLLEESIKKLENFQNSHNLLDPTQNAQSQFALLSQLQSQLINKEAQLNELSQYMNSKSFEIIRLKNEILNLKKTIKKIKNSLANPNKKALNIFIFEFERLKNMVEFNKELYKQSLIQYQQLKLDLNKNVKTLLKITNPFIPDDYKYPQKFKSIITLALILFFLYGIIVLINSIIKEHID
ncbi:hypothetical protein FE773_05765 [Caminibacter mediatlanticus TB-2]|uniref:Capsule biosynthesis protein n=1 Tax=Caminibacter mediatlanticus TB-2 TaxID=391592 RepID=A0ABX5VCL5_9BACT|nr:hypothetical protein [Caminibacter mediatlanticus]QCT94701.1 hypothetical protein FE773_05765 [Caminibacter mediatlanticus TB-2]